MAMIPIIETGWEAEDVEVSPVSITTQCGLDNYCYNGLRLSCDAPGRPPGVHVTCP